VNRPLTFLQHAGGRYRRWTGGRSQPPAARIIALATGAIVIAGTAFAVVPHGTTAPDASAGSSSFVSRDQISVPRLTAADVYKLEHLTPTQAGLINRELSQAFSKLGMRAGLGATPVNGITLTAYDWSAGASWDHAWVTASYANLKPYADAVIDIANVANRGAKLDILLSSLVCGGIGLLGAVVSAGVGAIAGVICADITGFIAYTAAAVHGPFPGYSNHGIWAQYYWTPGYHTPGGSW